MLALAALAATGALGAACLGARSAAELLLTAYVIAWAQVVVVALLLSPFELVTRAGLALGLAASTGLVALVWHVRGRPRPPSLRPALRTLLTELRSPLVATLAVVVGVCAVYVLGLAFLTPALEWDSLAYHLARAAFWEQQQAISYVPNASDPRLDGNPPGAEIGVLATMLLSGGDRFAALPQVLALGALLVAIAGIARRLGATHRQALLSSLVFAGLPLVAIQAPTSYNDLVVGSFLVICGFALVGRARLDLVLLALSLGMALTTKLTTLITLPLLALVALVGSPRRRYPALAGAGIAGLLLGAPWYLVNLIETGDADGGLAEHTDQKQELTLLAVMPTIRRYLFSFVDFSGSRDIGVFTLYGGVAIAVLAIGLVVGLARGRVRDTVLVAIGAAAVIVLPLALIELGRGALRGWFKFWLVLGREDIARADASWQLQVGSDAALSWYGPVAAALLVVGHGVRRPGRRSATSAAGGRRARVRAVRLHPRLLAPRPVGPLARAIHDRGRRVRGGGVGTGARASLGRLGRGGADRRRPAAVAPRHVHEAVEPPVRARARRAVDLDRPVGRRAGRPRRGGRRRAHVGGDRARRARAGCDRLARERLPVPVLRTWAAEPREARPGRRRPCPLRCEMARRSARGRGSSGAAAGRWSRRRRAGAPRSGRATAPARPSRSPLE